MYKIDNNILQNFTNNKFLKKDMRKILKDITKLFKLNTRGYKQIDVLGKKNNDGSIVIYEIGQWKEEKENNTFDYGIFLFNEKGELIYDECDGEIKGTARIYQYFDYIDCIEVANSIRNDIRKKIFYPQAYW